MITIRPFEASDHAALMELWCSAWEAVYPDIDFRARWPGMLARWDEMAESGSVAHVALIDGALAGFTVLNPRTGYLDQIAVSRSHWGSPLAAALMAHAKALSPGGLKLNVNQSNLRAVRFYEREGFVQVGTDINPRSGLPVFLYEWSGDQAASARSI